MELESRPLDPHPTGEALVEALEGAVFASGEAEEVDAGLSFARRHVERCPECRQRVARMREAVACFVEHNDTAYDVERRPPPGRWREFQPKLAQHVREAERERKPAGQGRKLAWMPRPRWVAGIAASVALVGLLLVHPGQSLSASEALDRGARVEASGIARPILYRKFRLESPFGTAHWEIWSAPSERQVHDRWSGQPGAVANLLTIYRHNQLGPESTLSASAFQHWRLASQPAKDEVKLDRAKGLVTVSTRRLAPATIGMIVESRLIMRQSDWRTVGQEFRVQAEQRIDEYRIEQVDYRAAEFTEDGWEQIAGPASAKQVETASPFPEAVAGTPRVDVESVELRVLAALRQAELDVTADLEVRAVRDGVDVSAYSCPPDERARLGAAVAGIPGVRLHFPAASRGSSAEQVYQGNGVSLPPAMLKQLEQAVGGEQAAGDRIARVNAAFAMARAHALALDRLVERNTRLGSAWMAREDLRPLVESLARAHAARAAARLDEIRDLLSPVLSARPPQKGQGCRFWSGQPPTLAELVADAQRVSDRLFTVTTAAADTDPRVDGGELAARLDKAWMELSECAR
jgi:hypothetical protein